MNKEHIITGVLIEETSTFTLIEVCQRFHITEDLIQELFDYGFFPMETSDIKRIQFTPKIIHRMESAFRLHRDLDINLPGVMLALELLEQIEALNSELKLLRRR